MPPKFIDSPESATVDEFSNVTLECRASGNPVPNITWNRDGGTVEQQEELLDSGVSAGVKWLTYSSKAPCEGIHTHVCLYM